MIEIAANKAHKENFKEKHKRDAKYGWYRYDSRFILFGKKVGISAEISKVN